MCFFMLVFLPFFEAIIFWLFALSPLAVFSSVPLLGFVLVDMFMLFLIALAD